MIDKSNDTTLRGRAEKHLSDTEASSSNMSTEETLRLLHELRVHQIELEMQNTELRQAQEEISISHNRYLDLFDNAPIGYLTINSNGIILRVNLTCTSMLGVARHDLLNHPLSKFIAHNGQDDYHFIRRNLENKGGYQAVDLPMIKSDGSTFWAHIDAVVVKNSGIDSTENIPVHRLTMSDITALKQAQEQSAFQASELSATMTSLADGLILFNPRGDVMRINDAAIRLLAFSSDPQALPFIDHLRSLQVKTPDGSVYPADEMPYERALRGMITTGSIMELHFSEQILWILASAAPVYLPDGQLMGAVMTISDITPVHDLQVQQLLLHLVSHDLSNPLAVINGHAQLIEEQVTKLGLDNITLQSVCAIQRGVLRMSALIEDLTELARIDGGQLNLNREAIDLSLFLQDFPKRFSTNLKMSRIHFDNSIKVPTVYADYNRLDRIVSNLLLNALKFSAPDTPITIRLLQQDNEVIVSVIDHGKGIPPSEKAFIFQRFFRSKNESRTTGTGLGLYITKQLVESHGGRIWVESEPDTGSIFSFTLPIA